MPNVSDVVFFILMNIDMHLFFAICTMMVLNFGFVELEDSDILGILRPSCRFEMHTSLVQWDEAYQACKHRGLTLASLGDHAVLSTLSSFFEKAQSVYSPKISTLDSRKYWVGLHMESSAGGSSEFHWGDCVISADITNKFNSLTNYAGDTACGYVNSESLRLTACSNTVSLGFICENPNGMDSCFTKAYTTMFSMGYESKTALTSSNCASRCLTSSSCGAIYVTAGDSCSILRYDTDQSSSMSASHLLSTHYFHRRFLYNGPYSLPFIVDPTEDELCNLPLLSPIVTTTISDVTTTESIVPTTTTEITTEPIDTSQPTEEITTDETTESDVTTQANEVTTAGDGVSTTAKISVYNFSSCVCVCVEKNITLEEKIEQMVSELKVDTSVLSSTIREKACAEDPRPSARNVGILGIAIFTVLFGFIISLDFIRFFQAAERYIVRKKQSSESDSSG